MATFRAEKVVSALPGTLEPNTIYLVRVGVGFDLYVSDSTGTVAHQVNNPGPNITVSNLQPSDPSIGDLWVDTN